ncbi:MAG: hypothetical protein ACYTKD_28955 [Planctomycetota bacterium]|jgi:hypothetical protein
MRAARLRLEDVRRRSPVLAGLLAGAALLAGGCFGREAVDRSFLTRPVMGFDSRDLNRDLSCEIGGAFSTADGGAAGCLT